MFRARPASPRPSSPTRCCRRCTPRSARWPGGLRLARRAGAPTGSTSSTSSCRWPGATARSAPPTVAGIAALLRRHLPADDPLRGVRRRPRHPGARRPAAARLPHRQHRPGAAGRDADGTPRYLVVDYKTNWLGAARPLTVGRLHARARWPAAMREAHYPLQALLYSVALHRFLRWRQPGYDPGTHLGGVLYLFLRGMCGPDTPGRRRDAERGVRLVAAGRAGHRPVRPAGGRRRDRRSTDDVQLVRRATGLLAAFNEAGVLAAADVHVATRLGRLGGESDDRVLLAAALAVRALRRWLGLPRPGHRPGHDRRGGRPGRGARRAGLARPGRVDGRRWGRARWSRSAPTATRRCRCG